MTTGEAVKICENIDKDWYTVTQKGEAAIKMLTMETHNSVKKETIINVAIWLWGLYFEYRGEE